MISPRPMRSSPSKGSEQFRGHAGSKPTPRQTGIGTAEAVYLRYTDVIKEFSACIDRNAALRVLHRAWPMSTSFPHCAQHSRASLDFWRAVLPILLAFLCPLSLSEARGQSEGGAPVIEGTLLYRGEQVPSRANLDRDPENHVRFMGSRPTIDIRYRISLLMAEPIRTFEARYEIPGEMQVVRNGLVVLTIRERRFPNRVSWSERSGTPPFAEQWLDIRVPRELYRKIRITSFRFSATALRIDTDAVREGWAMIDLENPGVPGTPGEWGWDVPAAPSWERLFRRGDLTSHGNGDRPWMDSESAQANFRRLASRRGNENTWAHLGSSGPFHARDIRELRVDTWRLIHVLRNEVPGIVGRFYSRPRDGEAVTLLSALERQEGSVAQGNREQAAQVVRRTLESMGTQVSPELVEIAREFEHRPLQQELEHELRALGSATTTMMQQIGETEEPEWLEELSLRLDALEARAARTGLPGDDPTVRRIAALQDALAGGLGRSGSIWIVATAERRPRGLSPPVGFHLTVVPATPTTRDETARERERRLEATREAQRDRARLAEETRREQEEVLRRGWVRSDPIRIRVPEEFVVESGQGNRELPSLHQWARVQLGEHLIARPDWQTASFFNVRAFTSEAEAWAWAESLEDHRPVPVEAPSEEQLQ